MEYWLENAIEKPAESLLQEWSKFLQEGQTFLYPSDTIYGVGCDASQPVAVEKVRIAKERLAEKNFLVLAPNTKSVHDEFELNEAEKKMISHCWPGPFTLLLRPRESSKLLHLRGENERIGVRIGKSAFLESLFQHFSGFLLSSSANLSGQPYLHETRSVAQDFWERVDHMILLRQYPLTAPSGLWVHENQLWKELRAGPQKLPEQGL